MEMNSEHRTEQSSPEVLSQSGAYMVGAYDAHQAEHSDSTRTAAIVPPAETDNDEIPVQYGCEYYDSDPIPELRGRMPDLSGLTLREVFEMPFDELLGLGDRSESGE